MLSGPIHPFGNEHTERADIYVHARAFEGLHAGGAILDADPLVPALPISATVAGHIPAVGGCGWDETIAALERYQRIMREGKLGSRKDRPL